MRTLSVFSFLLLLNLLIGCTSPVAPSAPPSVAGMLTVKSSSGDTAPFAPGESAPAFANMAEIRLGHFASVVTETIHRGDEWEFASESARVTVPASGPVRFELRMWGTTMKGEIR